MSLGSNFPPEFRQSQVKRRLRPGVVIKLEGRMDDGRLHEKRFVVLAVDEQTVTCVINSRISKYIEHRPEMLQCQVAMLQSDHPFMARDSHVDCSRTRTYATADIIRDLTRQPEWILGPISPGLRDSIVSALKYARTLAAAEAETLCRSLENGDVP